MLGTPGRRAAFLRIVRRVRAHERRWIYIATQTYGTILRTSIQPFALHSFAAREALIRQSCLRNGPGKIVIQAEIKALRRLDIPYFTRRTKSWMPPDKPPVPSELTEGIRKALQWTED
jgi:lantibiotic modifying enzyme